MALGATQSIAPPSVEEIKTWDRIHDPNLSVKDVIDVMEESKNMARIRYTSVVDQLGRTRERMKTRDYSGLGKSEFGGGKTKHPLVTSQDAFNKLKSGDKFQEEEGGPVFVKP